jgi:hypothetical protein
MTKQELRRLIKEEIRSLLVNENKVFSVSLTNNDKDEELVVYVKGANNKNAAIKKVKSSKKFKKEYPTFTKHLDTYDLEAEKYGLDDEEEKMFDGDLAFFDIEPM